jgi:hypothetical protein
VLLWAVRSMLRTVLRTMRLSIALLLDLLPAVPVPTDAAVLRLRSTVRSELPDVRTAVRMATRLRPAVRSTRLLAVHGADAVRRPNDPDRERGKRSG